MLADGILGNSVINNEAGDTTHVKDAYYEISSISGRVTRIEAGSIVAGATVKTDYEYGNSTQVANDDIIGGINGSTGKPEGLELVNSVFPLVVPGAGPGGSSLTAPMIRL
jgi:hypothetical protein